MKTEEETLRPIPKPSERDWKEDFTHENGNYMSQCIFCKQVFYGHKRRVVCKVCSDKKEL